MLHGADLAPAGSRFSDIFPSGVGPPLAQRFFFQISHNGLVVIFDGIARMDISVGENNAESGRTFAPNKARGIVGARFERFDVYALNFE